MSDARLDQVILGDVVVAVRSDGAIERAEAVGISGTRVAVVGSRDEALSAARRSTRVHDARRSAVVPGLHDFHIHLAALARARAEVRVDDAADVRGIAGRLREGAAGLADEAWVVGRGWSEAQLRGGVTALHYAVGERPAYLASHDGHSAWASPTALRLAGLVDRPDDPPGGRIERDSDGRPTGILRETALDLVNRLVPRLRGAALRPHLRAVVAQLSGLGITGASEAGDYTDEGGAGDDAALGDSYSTLTSLADELDGRLRLTLGIPADAIDAAVTRGMRTGTALDGRRTLRFGWAKEYADGALGSGTAALFEPATCGDAAGIGILRVTPAELDDLIARSRRAGIGMAVHAIGDRAAATVLDAIDRAPRAGQGSPRDRMEHLQLVRGDDRRRLAHLEVTASIQPIHAAADRDLVEECWNGRQADVYAWRSLRTAGALLAAGSDAPVESVNPWLGVFAAVHRRLPSDARDDWRPSEALTVSEALHAYTLGPALAIGRDDEGHLRPGARADLAVLDVGLDALLAGEVTFEAVRARLTMVDGAVVSD